MTATLFKDRKGKARPAPVPSHVARELTDVYGLDPRAVAGMSVRVAYARLYALRRKAMALTPEVRREVLAELAARLRRTAADPENDTADLTDLCTEALASLDRGPLARVATGLANLLTEIAA